MNTQKQLFIDQKVVRPIMLLVNLAVRIAGWVLRLNHDLEKVPKTIAVCKFKGMGSIVQATPLLHALKTRYPNTKLVFISSAANEAVLQEIPIIDQIVLLNDNGVWPLIRHYPAFIIKLISLRINVYIDLEIYANFSTLTSALSLATNRFGYYLRSSQFRLGIYTHMVYFNNRAPIAQAYFQMGRLLKSDLAFPQRVDAFSVTRQLPQKRIIVNVNASDLRIERRWPKAQFVQLINALSKAHAHCEIALIGSESEKAYVSAIHASLENDQNVKNVAGRTSFKGLLQLLASAQLLISNDSGPMHIAASLGVKTIALFGPCHPQQYGNHENVYPIYKNMYCSPCVHEFSTPPCLGDNQCMKQIEVNEVLLLAQKVLRYDAPTKQVAEQEEGLHYRSLDHKTLGVVKRSK